MPTDILSEDQWLVEYTKRFFTTKGVIVFKMEVVELHSANSFDTPKYLKFQFMTRAGIKFAAIRLWSGARYEDILNGAWSQVESVLGGFIICKRESLESPVLKKPFRGWHYHTTPFPRRGLQIG